MDLIVFPTPIFKTCANTSGTICLIMRPLEHYNIIYVRLLRDRNKVTNLVLHFQPWTKMHEVYRWN